MTSSALQRKKALLGGKIQKKKKSTIIMIASDSYRDYDVPSFFS